MPCGKKLLLMVTNFQGSTLLTQLKNVQEFTQPAWLTRHLVRIRAVTVQPVSNLHAEYCKVRKLYHINTVVDVVNLLSLYTGYSTAALDGACIAGNNVELGIGRANEPYQAIGRGLLNIENLPVYRDTEGAFATSTSDSTRTMVSLDTTNLLVLINAYDGDHQHLHEAIKYGVRCLEQYARASNIEVTIYASHITPQIEALQQKYDCC